jgi:hypothetical protein
MDFIFDDDDTAAVCGVSNQLIGGSKLDIVALAPELGHQVGASLNDPRPSGKVIEHLVGDVVGDGVEEVLAIHQVA